MSGLKGSLVNETTVILTWGAPISHGTLLPVPVIAVMMPEKIITFT